MVLGKLISNTMKNIGTTVKDGKSLKVAGSTRNISEEVALIMENKIMLF